MAGRIEMTDSEMLDAILRVAEHVREDTHQIAGAMAYVREIGRLARAAEGLAHENDRNYELLARIADESERQTRLLEEIAAALVAGTGI